LLKRKQDKMIDTGVFYFNAENFGTIKILKETEKAFLIIYSQTKRLGTSLSSKVVEHQKWIPKSVWNNPKNFTECKYMGEGDEVKCFNPPFFIK
jgi:hypothetical protein